MTGAIDSFSRATAAYQRALAADPAQPAGSEPAGSGDASFAAILKENLGEAIGAQRAAEQQAAAAVEGKGDLGHIITAVAEADVTLQAAVAVRDRVLEAYKDIMRMPI